MTKRDSFYRLPNAWNPGYAIPQYVMAEPMARGTFTTTWLPRGYIDTPTPQIIGVPQRELGKKLLGRPNAGLGSLGDDGTDAGHSLSGGSLGDHARKYLLEPLACGDDDDNGGSGGVHGYGVQAADWIMGSIGRVPAGARATALRALLDAIDPALWPAIDTKAGELRAKGAAPKAALHAALAAGLADGIAKEIVATGERVLRGEPVRPQGLSGLASSPTLRHHATTRAYEALGWNPFKAIGTAVKGIGHAIADEAKTAAGWVKDGVKALGGIACGLAGSGAGQVAATVGGGPAGAAGASAIANLCDKGDAAAAAAPPVAPIMRAPAAAKLPGWVVPAGLAGAGLAAFLLLRR